MSTHDSSFSVERLLTHQGLLTGLAKRLVGNDPDADDLVQDTWLAVLQAPAARTRNVRAWLSAVARNRWRNRRRDEEARARREQGAARTELVDDEAAERGIELRKRVLEAVAALPEKYRTAIYLRYLEERPIAEVAALTGVPDETARSRIQRGVELLRARLDREFGSRATWTSAVGAWCRSSAEARRVPPPAAPSASWPLAWIGAAALASCALVLGWIAWRSGGGADPRELSAPPGTSEVEVALAPEGGSARSGASSAARPPEAPAAAPLEARDAGEPSAAASPMTRTGHEHRDYRLRGRVLGPSGLPVEGASIVYLGTEWSTTDREGRFEMPLEISTYRKADELTRPSLPLIARREGYEPCVVRDLVQRLPEDPDAIFELELRLGDAPRALDGRIVRHDGRPAAGWQVALRNPGYAHAISRELGLQTLEGLASGQAGIQSADADGRFRLEGLGARPYDVIAWDPDSLQHALELAVPESCTQLSLTAPDPSSARRVAGRVASRSGAPLAGVRVRASRAVIELQGFDGPPTRARGRAVVTDAAGRFELPAELLDALQLVVEAGDLLVHDVTLDPLRQGEDWEAVELRVPLRCAVVLDARRAEPPADLLAFLDAAGAKLSVLLPAEEREAMGGLSLWKAVPLGPGPSLRTVHVGEDATTISFYDRDGTEVERRSIRLSADAPTTVVW